MCECIRSVYPEAVLINPMCDSIKNNMRRICVNCSSQAPSGSEPGRKEWDRVFFCFVFVRNGIQCLNNEATDTILL